MAWTVPTYAGTYMGGLPSNARSAMFELCRAVNERQAALAITKTTFYKANGTLAVDLTMADLLNIRTTGTASYGFQNLKKVRDAIISMVNAGYFTETSGLSDIWTKANLETAIGTDLDADPIRPQEARYWQAMQDALDLLIYGYGQFPFAPDSQTVGRTTSGSESDRPTAWANRADTSGGSASVSKSVFWGLSGTAGNYEAEIVDTAELNYRFDSFKAGGTGPEGTALGVLAESWIGVISATVNPSGWVDGSLSVGLTVDGDAKATTISDTTLYSVAGVSPSITEDFSILLDADAAPGTSPFNSLGRWGWGVYYIDLYIDLASVLADQA